MRSWLDTGWTSVASNISSAAGLDQILPTRLLRIQGEGNLFVELCIAKDQDTSIRYGTLSHCWCRVIDILILTILNLETLKSSIHIRNLPKTFQDAMKITKTLGLSYIWIDSLCII